MARKQKQELTPVQQAELQLKAAKRLLSARKAQDSLLDFVRMMMPDPEDPDNTDRSRYQIARHHEVFAEALQAVEKGEIPRLIITCPPRHGKSQISSKAFPAWFMGKDPYRQLITASYSATMAEDFGREVRQYMQSPIYQQIFPNCQLRKGGASSDRIQTEQGGIGVFVGAGGALTGRGADVLLVDDPVKDRDDADSVTMRNKLWGWFTDVAMTRLMGGMGRVVIIMCMTGDTPVLMADGTEKPLRDVRPGDRVKSYKDGAIVESKVLNWKSQGDDKVLEITTSSGRKVRANARHPFLVVRNNQELWLRTGAIQKGDIILRVTEESGQERPVAKTDATNQQSVTGGACLTTSRKNGRVVTEHRLPSMLIQGAKRVFGAVMESAKPIIWQCLRSKAVAALSAKAPLLLKMFALTGTASSASTIVATPEKSEDSCVTTAISLLAMGRPQKSCDQQPNTYSVIRDEVVNISDAGTEEVFDVQIEDTENFIANGLISHNTRWHEDDLVGRLTDPNNPYYNAEEAKQWKIIHFTALAEDGDIMGRPKDEPLWPERITKEFLVSQRRMNPRGFAALYQGRPAPEDGDFFKREWLATYQPTDLPKNLRIYCASDHAVSTAQDRDPTVLLAVGVDEDDTIWVLPDVWWRREETDHVVDAMLEMMARNKPLIWWAERGHISKSIGPFLRKRMQEEQIYCAIDEVVPVKDKQTRAQAIRGRMAMGKVRFPGFAPWWEAARHQMLTFPAGKNDDFVDAFAYIGLGLGRMVTASSPTRKKPEPAVGTLAWVKHRSTIEARYKAQAKTIAGF